MVQAHRFGSYIRRRRFFLLKLFVLFFFVITLLIWTRVNNGEKEGTNSNNGESNALSDKIETYEKNPNIDKPMVGGIPQNPNEIKVFAGHFVDEDELRKVKKENTDEFLVPVLQNFKYDEVNLYKKHVEAFDDYDDEIVDDEKRVKPGLGDGGDKAYVPDYQKAVAAEVEKKEAFNRILSELMSVNRTVPDTREETCRSVEYDDDLPDMSVIIIFTNEAFTSLVRTLHSVINQTPSKYLREIILVDDFSDKRDLKGKLERYIATRLPYGKIRLARLHQRSGLIRARMIGAHLAFGKVLLFLDAHCEAGPKWAEPILQRIKEDRKAVVCPIIDVIDDKTLEYYHGNGAFFQIGGFTWSGHFTWINIPDYEAKRKANHHSPTRSPTMAGGLFGIDRKYFWEIGSYDSDMQLWGGENLEMSFRIWQCGGSVEIIPCSRVGHIFRNFHPYTFPNNVDSHGLNTARLAEVWMEEYKELFYTHRSDLRTAEWGDVSKRKEFKKRYGCKSFKWFLDNIYKEKFQMQFSSKKIGQVRNLKSNMCLDNMQHSESEEYILGVYPCHSVAYSSQIFLLSNENHLRRENECATAKGENVKMVQCDHLFNDESWDFDGSTLKNKRSGKCLTVGKGSEDKWELSLKTCKSSLFQDWQFLEKKNIK